MWPDERTSLAVWADRQLAAGQTIGELVALHLRAQELTQANATAVAGSRGRSHAEACALLERAEALRQTHAEALLGPLVGELPHLRLRWDLGVVRAVHLDPQPGFGHPRAQLILEVLTQLLRRPALRFVDDIHLAIDEYDDEFEFGLLALLGAPSCQARPRRMILGGMPRRFRVIHGLSGPHAHRRYGHLNRERLAPATARGLTWLARWGHVQSLPWTPGDHGSRLQALERILALPWSDAVERDLGRAMWDTSVKVRRRVILALDALPDGAAPLILAALAMERDARDGLRPLLERTLTRASTRPAVVAAIASHFVATEYWVATWLSGVSRRSRRQASAHGAPRLRAMLARERVQGHGEGALRRGLLALDAGDAATAPPGPCVGDETIAELLDKRSQSS